MSDEWRTEEGRTAAGRQQQLVEPPPTHGHGVLEDRERLEEMWDPAEKAAGMSRDEALQILLKDTPNAAFRTACKEACMLGKTGQN